MSHNNIVLGIVTVDAVVSYWPMFFPIPSSSPRSLFKSSWTSFPLVSKGVNEESIFFFQLVVLCLPQAG